MKETIEQFPLMVMDVFGLALYSSGKFDQEPNGATNF